MHLANLKEELKSEIWNEYTTTPPPLLPLTCCFGINENKVQYCIGGAGDESLGLWEKNTRGKFQKLWCCIDKDIKKCTKCIVELYKHTGILKNMREVQRRTSQRWVFLTLLVIVNCTSSYQWHRLHALYLKSALMWSKAHACSDQSQHTHFSEHFIIGIMTR